VYQSRSKTQSNQDPDKYSEHDQQCDDRQCLKEEDYAKNVPAEQHIFAAERDDRLA
jgi:hypothetical protein